MPPTRDDWYKSWFADRRYLELYGHRDDEEADKLVSLIEAVTGDDRDRTILDVACGAGRHLIAFARRGYTKLFGQDLSPTLIAEAREDADGSNIAFSVRDMREPIEGKYDLILNIFTSFGYFSSDEENERVIRNCSQALNEGGCLVLDYLNAPYVLSNLVATDERKLPGGERVWQQREIVDGRIVKHIKFDTGAEFIESVRLYEKGTIEAMFARAGLEANEVFGSYEGTSYDPQQSPRLILFACNR